MCGVCVCVCVCVVHGVCVYACVCVYVCVWYTVCVHGVCMDGGGDDHIGNRTLTISNRPSLLKRLDIAKVVVAQAARA